jgi:hypothetical protein
MNTNEISPKANAVNPRLKRIKYMSRFLKGLLLANFVAIGVLYVCARNGLIGDLAPAALSSKEGIYNALCYALILLGIIAFYRLLNLYEKGVIFSAENVVQIRRLGYLAMAYGLLTAIPSVFLPNHGIFSVPATLINFLFSPWFFTGCFVIIITWIMDEGLKIQEEQELTV